MTAGRDLLEASPSDSVALHLERWPVGWEVVHRALGRLLGPVLCGEDVLRWRPAETGGGTVEITEFRDEDRDALAYLAHQQDGARGVDLQAVTLPHVLRQERVWLMAYGPSRAYVRRDGVDDAVVARLLAPVMADLTVVLRLRAGVGPKTDKGRAARLQRCRTAHEFLGLAAEPIAPLLRTDLELDDVVDARARLIESWSEHPEDIGARAMAWLCSDLVRSYYAKARKDGSADEDRVIGTTTRPVLEATLRTWDGLVAYVGEEPRDTSERSRAPIHIAPIPIPSNTPAPVAQRVDVLRRWWEVYDELHAAQAPGDPTLWGLVPTAFGPAAGQADEDDPDEPHGPRYILADRALPEPLRSDILDHWKWQVALSTPTVLISAGSPLASFAQLLEPAIRFWEDVALTCWYLCFGPYSRCMLDELEARTSGAAEHLAGMGAPVDSALFRELCAAGEGHPFLFEHLGVSIQISLGCRITIRAARAQEHERGRPGRRGRAGPARGTGVV